MPHVIVIAGPNGAGKSTAAPALLHGLLGIEHFVNADVIARGLSAFDPESVAIQAGRIMLERLRELASRGEDFAFETTLASRSFAPWIAGLRREQGYTFSLHYLWVPAPRFSVGRVARRVSEGGHFVPPEVVERRFYGGISNFFTLYRPIADRWYLYDNSRRVALHKVAEGKGDGLPVVYDGGVWEQIQKDAGRT